MGRPQIISDGARAFDAHLALPALDAEPVAVLLLPEMFGLSAAMCAAADGLADAGYATAVPNVFWRAAHPRTLEYDGEDRRLAWERLQALDLAQVVADIERAAVWLRAESGAARIVALGHCIGGRLAVLALSTSVVGAISYYGLGISKLGAALARQTKPAQLHYGLADEHVPAAEIEAVVEGAAGNPAIEIFRYPGAGHSFCNPSRPMFDADAAALVRRRTLAFLADVASATSKGVTS